MDDPLGMLGKVPFGMEGMAKELGGGTPKFDPSMIPAAAIFELVMAHWEWKLAPDEINPSGSRMILVITCPVLPFLKMQIPFDNSDSLLAFAQSTGDALSAFKDYAEPSNPTA